MMRAIFLLVLGASIAYAQPVDKQKQATAKQYVNAGLAAQNAKDYDTAIAMYTKAYELVPHPVLLFNLGQAHRLAGRVDKALEYYDSYLAVDPKGDQAKTARELADEIRAQKAKAAAELVARDQKERDDAAAKAAAAKAAKDREAREAKEREAKQREAPPPAGTSGTSGTAGIAGPTQPVARDEGHPGRSLKIAGIATGAVGLVTVGVSIFYGLKSKSISDDLSKPGAMYDPSKVDDGESAERMSIITGVAGGVLIAGGIVTYYLGSRQARDAKHVTLVVSPSTAGIAFDF